MIPEKKKITRAAIWQPKPEGKLVKPASASLKPLLNPVPQMENWETNPPNPPNPPTPPPKGAMWDGAGRRLSTRDGKKNHHVPHAAMNADELGLLPDLPPRPRRPRLHGPQEGPPRLRLRLRRLYRRRSQPGNFLRAKPTDQRLRNVLFFLAAGLRGPFSLH